MNILLIEDESKVASFIKKGLEEQGHHITLASDGRVGKDIVTREDFDIVILDVLLPVFNGLEVCKYIRQYNKDLPILMLSALGTLNDRVNGLTSGADDYLTKPFHFEELLARIKALVRRQPAVVPGNVYTVGNLVMDSYKKTVTRGGQEISLTFKEFVLLEVLMANKGRVLSRAYISEAVWGNEFKANSNLVDVYINYVRNKINKGFTEKYIHTVIGMGYVLKEVK